MKKPIKIIIAILLMQILHIGNIFSQDIAKGYVFNDLNKNAVFDKGEGGIEGIMVSNGEEIVKTDKKGAYNIPLKSGMTLFVVKPSGWATPTDSNNIPQFFYTHKPQGSPSLKYQGSLPTRSLPKEINFALYESHEPDTFDIFIFGDPQASNLRQIQYLAKSVISEIVSDTTKKFGITLGDILNDNLQDYPFITQLHAQAGIPWYYVAGNHDVNFDAPNERQTSETFEATFGPSTFAFQYGKAHFILLDDVIYTGNPKQRYIGGIRDDQFAFIENYLSVIPKRELVVLCMHIPIFKEEADYYEGIETFRIEDKYRLFALLEKHPNTISMSAHTHFVQQYFFKENEGWKQSKPHHHFNVGATCGDWFNGLYRFNGYPDATMRDGTPLGYAILSINGNQYHTKYKVIGAPESKQMDLHYDKNNLYANFYMGSEFCNVYYRINNSEDWIIMTKTTEPDPRAVIMRNRIKNSLDVCDNNLPGRQISVPQPCHHLWKAYLNDNDINSGFNTVEVKVIDHYNFTYTEKLVFYKN